ncbi:unnamed protein product [Schistosoma guineensis]|nr:unnamed protein product [Schistosoma guineensis]
MLQFYFGLYGLAIFLCFLGFLYALIEKAYKQLKTNINKSHLSNYSEIISSNSNQNSTTHKKISSIIEKVEQNSLMDTMKTNEIFESSYNQENNENQLNDSDISTPTEEMKTIINGKYIENNHDQIHAKLDISMKSFSERRQERRKRYKAKKGQSSSFGCFSINSSIDEYDTGNTLIEDSDETTNVSNCSMLSDSNDSQPDYFILETHNMCELRNSIQITNLDDAETDNINHNDINIMDKTDSLDITLKSSYKYG